MGLSRSVMPDIMFYISHFNIQEKYLDHSANKLVSNMLMSLFQPFNDVSCNDFGGLSSSCPFKSLGDFRLRQFLLFETWRENICRESAMNVNIVKYTFFSKGISQHT